MDLIPSGQFVKKMDYKLKITKEAHEDLNNIIDYTAHSLSNPIAAARFLDEVEKQYREVVKNPFMYAVCRDERLKQAGYRKFLVKNYLVFYRVEDAEQIIYILRIIYAGRDYEKLI